MSSCKTRDFPVEMIDEQKEAIVYRSKLLNKYYESYDDMLKEEAEFKRQNEEKLKAQEEKKAIDPHKLRLKPLPCLYILRQKLHLDYY